MSGFGEDESQDAEPCEQEALVPYVPEPDAAPAGWKRVQGSRVLLARASSASEPRTATTTRKRTAVSDVVEC